MNTDKDHLALPSAEAPCGGEDRTALKPCPFCGSEAVAHWSFGAEYIDCSECGAEVAADTLTEAFEAWNRRAPSADKAGAVPLARVSIGNTALGNGMKFTALTDAGRALPPGTYDLYAAPPTPLLREAMDRLENIVAKPDYTNPEGMVRDIRAALAKLREGTQ